MMQGGTAAQKAMVQDAVNRWWWPCLMMFGPPDDQSPNSAQSHALGHQAHLQRRRCGRSSSTPPWSRPQVLGVTLPDPDLKWNEERQHWDFGAIDWAEFWRVVGGDGPCNRERLRRASTPGTTAPGCARRRWRMRASSAK